MTVAELVVAVAAVAVIGAAVTGLSFALSSAHAHSQDHYLHMQSAHNAAVRLRELIGSSVLITAADETTLVLWVGDKQLNGEINRNEMVLVEWNAAAGEIGTYRVNIGDYEWGNYETPLAEFTDTASAEWEIKNDSLVTYTPLAQGISQFAFSCEPATPLARRVDFQIVAGPPQPEERPAVLRSSAVLWHDKTDCVKWTGSEWILVSGGSSGGGGEED